MKNSELITDIEVQATGLSLDRSRRGTCPKCKSNRGFVMSHVNNGIVYVCHRASCDVKGIIRPKRKSQSQLVPVRSLPPLHVFQEYIPWVNSKGFDTIPLSEDVWNRLVLDRGVKVSFKEAKLSRVRFCTKTNRLIFPLFYLGKAEPMGFQAYNNKITPKARTFLMEHEGTMPAHYRAQGPMYANAECIVVVEDILSAMALGQAGIPAIALLGTYLNHNLAHAIAALTYNMLVLLDGDAYSAAERIRNEYKHLLNIRIHKLIEGVDPKHLSDSELHRIVGLHKGKKNHAI